MIVPKITQAMIDAYDEYTHLTFDRVAFMERLTALSGSSAAAEIIAAMLAANSEQVGIVAVGDERIVSKDISWSGSTGPMNGYLVQPAKQTGRLPAVLVIHENRGLNAHMKDIARRYALEGFIALVPDFLSPLGGTPEDEDEARDMIRTLERDQVVNDAIASVDYLQNLSLSNGKVGAVGFCWGGGMVNHLAVKANNLKAGVAYYGSQADASQVSSINAPLMLHYAEKDERINAGIQTYTDALDGAGKEYILHMYEGVHHAFSNDTTAARYNKPAAELAWKRTIAFFKQKLD